RSPSPARPVPQRSRGRDGLRPVSACSELRPRRGGLHLADEPRRHPAAHRPLPAARPLESPRAARARLEPVDVVLEAVGLAKTFGAVKAADDLSVRISSGQIVGIVGPNGSGKTTFLNLVTGYLSPARGQIYYLGKEITGLHPRQVTRLGVARSFQVPQLYTSLTGLENMLVALVIRSGRQGDCWRALRTRARLAEARHLLEKFGFGGGRIIADAPPGALFADPVVRRYILGEE